MTTIEVIRAVRSEDVPYLLRGLRCIRLRIQPQSKVIRAMWLGYSVHLLRGLRVRSPSSQGRRPSGELLLPTGPSTRS